MPSSSFHIVRYNNSIITVYCFFRYTSVATNLIIVDLFKVGLSPVWKKKYFFFFKVNYLSSSKAEVSKFASLSWYQQQEEKIIKNYRKPN